VNLVLGNIDYEKHTSSEGRELQNGLVHAGWNIAGPGFPEGGKDVAVLVKRLQPERIFVQDVRDWLPESNISFRKDIGFERMGYIGDSRIPAYTIIKDAWGWKDIQSRLARDINAAGIACYYRTEMVRREASWIGPYPLIRIHHSVDRDVVEPLLAAADGHKRRNALVSGFIQPCYPLRRMAFQFAHELGLDTRPHPGYGNRGADTPQYLQTLAQYKVHLATASHWGCAFRKIIESVACGATPVTNLPATDVLPEIDRALVRIPPDIALNDLKPVIECAVKSWDFDHRLWFARKALDYYDWRPSGVRLSNLLTANA
jgi:hypothetical protein